MAGDLAAPSPQNVANAGATMLDRSASLSAVSAVSDTIDRGATTFLGVSKELGLGAAVAFAFMALGAIGWGVQHYTITIPEHKQMLKDHQVENETKEKVAEGFGLLSALVASQGVDLRSVRQEVNSVSMVVGQLKENDQAKWRRLAEIHDEIRAVNGKPPLPRVPMPTTSATAAAEKHASERPDAPPMPEPEKPQ